MAKARKSASHEMPSIRTYPTVCSHQFKFDGSAVNFIFLRSVMHGSSPQQKNKTIATQTQTETQSGILRSFYSL